MFELMLDVVVDGFKTGWPMLLFLGTIVTAMTWYGLRVEREGSED